MKRLLALSLILLLLLVASACTRTSTAPKDVAGLYFGSTDAYLREETREQPASFPALAPARQAEELLQQLLDGPRSPGYVRVIPEGTRFLGIAYDEGDKLLTVYVSADFARAAGSAGELLAVYSVVNTLVQLEGIDYVTIEIEGAELSHLDQPKRLAFNPDLVEKK